jgi:hypothetical protein
MKTIITLIAVIAIATIIYAAGAPTVAGIFAIVGGWMAGR